MNPTFNLSAARAAPLMLPASRSAAAAAKIVFLIVNLQTVGGNDSPGRGAPSRTPGILNQRSGTNTVPKAAGAVEPPVLAREIKTRTMTVARYGSADMNCEGIPKPAPCACNCRIVTAPNRYAPTTRRPGRHDANTTSASAIQPRPAVMPGMKNGVYASGR